MFVDYLKIKVKAGDGGHGSISFLREAMMPKGGPAGGDGGRGGDVIFVADPKLGTLLDLRYHRNIEAGRGGNGGNKNCHGADGDDVVIRVPQGTTVTDGDTGEYLADLTDPGERWIAAKGGRGGYGNAHFATPGNKTPRFAQDGSPGAERHLILELKLIAAVGLIGLPNAGKSTLLSKLTAAKPKIASYPFTTLSPNLGIIEYEDLFHLPIADIPGLIEGASHGVGLGDRFLRHIERTSILAHLIGDEAGIFDPDDMLYKYDLVCSELAAYSDTLARKPQIVIITKIDLADPEDLEKTCAAFRARGIEPICISADTGQGVEELKPLFRARAEEHGVISAPIPPPPPALPVAEAAEAESAEEEFDEEDGDYEDVEEDTEEDDHRES